MLSIGFAAIALLAGCAPEGESPFSPSEESSDSRAITTATIQYEGSCEFLVNCSVFSKNGVSWGCGGSDCDTATTRYVAAPASYAGYCGEEVTVCLSGTDTCTNATIKDMSCCNRWEAGPAVLRDLGVSFGENVEACSGFGEAEVTIYKGSMGGGGGGEDFNGYYCTDPGGSCDGNAPCWAECPAGSSCDFDEGSWGHCRGSDTSPDPTETEPEGEFNGYYCTDPGGFCDGNAPCWAECPGGSTCDFEEDDWGRCRE